MDDLISRQAVNDALDKTCDIVCQYSKKQRYAMCGACPLGSAFDAVANVPSVDAVEVVQCKDCVNCQIDTIFDCYWCDGKRVYPDDYCSYGSR